MVREAECGQTPATRVGGVDGKNSCGGHAGRLALRITGMKPRRSRTWAVLLPVAYAFIRAIDPVVRWAWFSAGIGITSRLTVVGRRTGRSRSVLVGLIRARGAWYVGHPNGEVGWTANLRAAESARIAPRPEASIDVRAIPLEAGAERTDVILATGEQQPFPANLLYSAARRHILAVGQYFRLEPTGAARRVQGPDRPIAEGHAGDRSARSAAGGTARRPRSCCAERRAAA